MAMRRLRRSSIERSLSREIKARKLFLYSCRQIARLVTATFVRHITNSAWNKSDISRIIGPRFYKCSVISCLLTTDDLLWQSIRRARLTGEIPRSTITASTDIAHKIGKQPKKTTADRLKVGIVNAVAAELIYSLEYSKNAQILAHLEALA